MSSAVGCHSRSVRRILRVGHLAPVVALLVCPRSVHAQDVRGKLGKARHALDRATEERQTRRATERFDPIFKKNKENAKRWRYAETLDYVKLIRANKDSLTPR